jgi:hypothetical protein
MLARLAPDSIACRIGEGLVVGIKKLSPLPIFSKGNTHSNSSCRFRLLLL